MFDKLIQTLKNAPKTIVFTEGNDPRILEASAKILQDDFLKPILVGSEEEILGVAKKNGFNVEGATIIDPANYDKMDEMIDTLCELRKKKGLTREDAAKMLSQANYFGTMLVKMGYADALLGGATYSTGASASVSGSTVTITTSGDFDVTLKAQSRISSVTVYYTGSAE